MADVPEHLLKRSRERRKALGLPVDGEEDDAPVAAAPDAGGGETAPAEEAAPVAASADAGEVITESVGGVPAALLERSRKRKAALAGGGGGAAPSGGGGTACLPPQVEHPSVNVCSRCLWRNASSCAIIPPIETPNTCTRSSWSASKSPLASSANISSV